MMAFRRTSMTSLADTVLLFILMVLPVSAQHIVRGPYLQQGTDHSIIVKWRTDKTTDSRVDFGTTAGRLNQRVLDTTTETTEHEVKLTGLSPYTRYYYAIGNSLGLLVGDSSYHFRTSPRFGATGATRIWVIGDSGTADTNAAGVRDAYKRFAGATETHLWLMLGDNAYNNGTDSEYQAAVFDTYPEMLRQVPLWPTLGNHDARTADSATQTGPYYDIFTLPKNGEAGGVASGTEAYYSFEYRNIHFVVLDSYETDRASTGPMLTWLENDLAANHKDWVVAFWHHPPYSKGSHDSDRERALVEMREHALPILENYGVDLVLTGHSHSYERSFLIDGHYGASSTFDPVRHLVDGGDGRVGGDGAYAKSSDVAAPNAGAVYAVAGSSGKTGGGALNHPVMFYSVNTLGAMILDINGNQLDAKFLDSAANVRDAFTISKGPDMTPPVIKAVTAIDSTTVQAPGPAASGNN